MGGSCYFRATGGQYYFDEAALGPSELMCCQAYCRVLHRLLHVRTQAKSADPLQLNESNQAASLQGLLPAQLQSYHHEQGKLSLQSKKGARDQLKCQHSREAELQPKDPVFAFCGSMSLITSPLSFCVLRQMKLIAFLIGIFFVTADLRKRPWHF